KNGSEGGARRGNRRLSRARLEHFALRDRGAGISAESSGDSNRELLYVPCADRAAAAVFPAGRKTVSGAAPADFCLANLRDDSRERVGRDQAAVDDYVACDCSVAAAGAVIRRRRLRDADSVVAPRLAANRSAN